MKKETDLQKRTREETESHTKGGPKTGVTMPARKVNPNGEGQAEPYRFNQDNEVRDAKEVPGACKAAADKQVGLNKSKLKPGDLPNCSDD